MINQITILVDIVCSYETKQIEFMTQNLLTHPKKNKAKGTEFVMISFILVLMM